MKPFMAPNTFVVEKCVRYTFVVSKKRSAHPTLCALLRTFVVEKYYGTLKQ
jgi:hypothetical protein